MPVEHAWEVTEPGDVGGAFGARPTATAGRRDSVNGLPPGEYYVVAADDLESEAVHDPLALESLSHSASRITLTDSAPAEVSLRRVKVPDPGAGR